MSILDETERTELIAVLQGRVSRNHRASASLLASLMGGFATDRQVQVIRAIRDEDLRRKTSAARAQAAQLPQVFDCGPLVANLLWQALMAKPDVAAAVVNLSNVADRENRLQVLRLAAEHNLSLTDHQIREAVLHAVEADRLCHRDADLEE